MERSGTPELSSESQVNLLKSGAPNSKRVGSKQNQNVKKLKGSEPSSVGWNQNPDKRFGW